ncbi:MAG: MFS transporter [Alphaproteobacteria bacterium]|nr:MFS transporter [Alphaproteobacteria bacterium]
MAAAVSNIFNFIFGLIVLPESLPKHLRRDIKLQQLNPFKSILKVLKPSPYALLIWIYFLLFLAGNVHPVNWTLYTETKFGWTAWQVGLSLSFVGLMISITQGVLTRILIPKLGAERALTLGIFVYATGFFFFAAASNTWFMYATIVYFALSGLAIPALQSIIGKFVPANEQGELQGSLVSLASLATIIAPFIYTYLFVTFTKPAAPVYFPGAAYIGAAGICVATMALWLARKR